MNNLKRRLYKIFISLSIFLNALGMWNDGNEWLMGGGIFFLIFACFCLYENEEEVKSES